MDMELLLIFTFTFLTTLVVAITIGGVILLRPITRHLGKLLEAKAEERRALSGRAPEDWDRLFSALDGVLDRLQALEDRQEFTEKLLSKPREGGSGDQETQ
jgi:hypothetical protein